MGVTAGYGKARKLVLVKAGKFRHDYDGPSDRRANRPKERDRGGKMNAHRRCHCA